MPRSTAWAGSTRKATLPPDWYSYRQPATIARDPVCTCAGPSEGCRRHPGQPCTARSTDADHMGDREDHRLEMLAGKCSECHDAKSSTQGTEARWKHREQRETERPPGLL